MYIYFIMYLLIYWWWCTGILISIYMGVVYICILHIYIYIHKYVYIYSFYIDIHNKVHMWFLSHTPSCSPPERGGLWMCPTFKEYTTNAPPNSWRHVYSATSHHFGDACCRTASVRQPSKSELFPQPHSMLPIPLAHHRYLIVDIAKAASHGTLRGISRHYLPVPDTPPYSASRGRRAGKKAHERRAEGGRRGGGEWDATLAVAVPGKSPQRTSTSKRAARHPARAGGSRWCDA